MALNLNLSTSKRKHARRKRTILLYMACNHGLVLYKISHTRDRKYRCLHVTNSKVLATLR